MESLALPRELIQLPGLSRYEEPIQKCVRMEWELLSDEIRVARIGSLYARKHGSGMEPRQSVMLAARMDAIDVENAASLLTEILSASILFPLNSKA